MKNSLQKAIILVFLLAAALARPAGVWAGEPIPVFHELDLELGAVGKGTALRDNLHVAPISEQNTELKYVVSPQVSKDLLLRLGAQWQRFSFPDRQHQAAPDTLQQGNAILGFDYQLGEQWLMRAEVEPGLYGDLSQPSWRSFDAPIKMGFAYLVDADLQWFFGLRVDARSQYPVFPAAGVRWKFSDVWTLDLQLPNPRLEYDLNDKFQAYLGVGILAGSYVMGDRYGTERGLPQLNRATLDYTELRLGPGFSWKARPNLTLEAEAGYVLYRSWDFFDQHINPSSSPLPSLQFALHARF
jgi:opacity protein-like surface antigen